MEIYTQSISDNSTSVYVPSDLSLSNHTTKRSFNIFPSVNATYCEASDDACTDCRAIAMNSSTTSSHVFCVGANGCLCFAWCEPSIWKTRAMASECGYVSPTPVPGALTPSAADSTYAAGYDTAQIFITAAQAFGVFTLIYVGIRGRSSESHALLMLSIGQHAHCVYYF